MRVGWSEVLARRLARHGLIRPFVGGTQTAVEEAVSAMVGAHAQIMSAAEMSIGLRVENATRTWVQEALSAGGSLVKTVGPRGTVHLLPASELGMWLGALSALPEHSGLPEGVRLSPEQTDEVVAAIADALEHSEGSPPVALTTDELGAEVMARLGSWAGELTVPGFNGFWARWRQAIAPAAYRGALCFGQNRGTKVSYTRPPAFATVPDAEALLLRAYLHSYGPATQADYARWLATPLSRVGPVFERAKLERVEVADAGPADSVAWVNAGDTEFPAEAGSGIRLLPYFDPYVVGSQPRGKLFPGPAFDRALARGQAGNFPVMLLDGVVAGVWHQRRSGSRRGVPRIAVTVEPLVKLTKRHRAALEKQAQRLGEILEGDAELSIGTVPVGPHA